MKRRRRWLRVGAFVVCESAEVSQPPPGPWVLRGVWHVFDVRSPLADLPGGSPVVPMCLFAQVVSGLERLSRPRELEAHVIDHASGGLLCRYRFPPQSFRPGTMTYLALPIQPPPIRAAGWYDVLLVLDDPRRSVLARTQVHLTP